jgi:hypothetical protein
MPATTREIAMKRGLVALAVALPAALAGADAGKTVDYPAGYRDWRHVKSMVIEPGHALADSFGGIHHIYANEEALEGYSTGGFPDGSIIVFDLLAAVSADQTVTEGKRKLVGVMVKDRSRFQSTGGWGFEGFAGDSKTERLVGDKAAEACFGCHQSRKDHDFVFSSSR